MSRCRLFWSKDYKDPPALRFIMPCLPDISDFLEVKETVSRLQRELSKVGEELFSADYTLQRKQEEVIRRYRAAGIGEEDCNHPLWVYRWLGKTQCECCGKWGSYQEQEKNK